jgi:hypothetical protein
MSRRLVTYPAQNRWYSEHLFFGAPALPGKVRDSLSTSALDYSARCAMCELAFFEYIFRRIGRLDHIENLAALVKK